MFRWSICCCFSDSFIISILSWGVGDIVRYPQLFSKTQIAGEFCTKIQRASSSPTSVGCGLAPSFGTKFTSLSAFFNVDRQPSTVNRLHTPQSLCDSSPTLGEQLSQFSQMRISESRGCSQTLPSGSILDKILFCQFSIPFLLFLLFLALKQTSLALRTISPNIRGENQTPRPSATPSNLEGE